MHCCRQKTSCSGGSRTVEVMLGCRQVYSASPAPFYEFIFNSSNFALWWRKRYCCCTVVNRQEGCSFSVSGWRIPETASLLWEDFCCSVFQPNVLSSKGHREGVRFSSQFKSCKLRCSGTLFHFISICNFLKQSNSNGNCFMRTFCCFCITLLPF